MEGLLSTGPTLSSFGQPCIYYEQHKRHPQLEKIPYIFINLLDLAFFFGFIMLNKKMSSSQFQIYPTSNHLGATAFKTMFRTTPATLGLLIKIARIKTKDWETKIFTSLRVTFQGYPFSGTIFFIVFIPLI